MCQGVLSDHNTVQICLTYYVCHVLCISVDLDSHGIRTAVIISQGILYLTTISIFSCECLVCLCMCLGVMHDNVQICVTCYVCHVPCA